LCSVDIPLVSEVAVELEDPVHAAHDQSLEIELGGDAQVEVEVERVVVGDEGARERAAGDGLHHRRLDLEKAARREEAAEGPCRSSARFRKTSRVSGWRARSRIALAVAALDVLQAVPLLGKRLQRLGEVAHGLAATVSSFVLVRKSPSFDADQVAEVELAETAPSASSRSRRAGTWICKRPLAS
jgi:hypothetical protein